MVYRLGLAGVFLDYSLLQAIIRNIESFLLRLMIHLIKNQIEQRLTNSWANSISDSIVQIKKLNLKDNKNSYYINSDESLTYLEAAVKLAIRPASLEIFNRVDITLAELPSSDEWQSD